MQFCFPLVLIAQNEFRQNLGNRFGQGQSERFKAGKLERSEFAGKGADASERRIEGKAQSLTNAPKKKKKKKKKNPNSFFLLVFGCDFLVEVFEKPGETHGRGDGVFDEQRSEQRTFVRIASSAQAHLLEHCGILHSPLRNQTLHSTSPVRRRPATT
jgi:hypothetical protein